MPGLPSLVEVFRFALTLANFARYRFPTEDNAWIREPKPAAGLAIFFVVLIAGTAYFERKIFVLSGDIGRHLNLIYALMWWVTVASVVARLIMRESPRDVSFRWGGWAGTRAILIATALPLIIGLVAYGVAWSTGLAKFNPPNPTHPFLGVSLGGAR